MFHDARDIYKSKEKPSTGSSDFLKDEDIPKALKDSLISQDTNEEEVMKILDRKSNQAKETTEIEFHLKFRRRASQVNLSALNDNQIEEENIWNDARCCPDNCDESCPFKCPSSSEIFLADHTRFDTSSQSLLRKASSMSVISSTEHERSEFLSLTNLIPLHHSSVIIRWNVKSIVGIKGYKVYLDGRLKSKIYSSERTSALITNVDLTRSHNFLILIIPDEKHKLYSHEFLFKNNLIKPLSYWYLPIKNEIL
ncbi:CLUMA_CG010166, isoform A [Clunio marinus]|uniref:CLUMA_CG010166, isoform A n=1 Tax=Clunio marinus TaxID=568069 RepID=A0A1J1IEE7_9DIPT|nr:CLUMA_CG010166, isoform A [Clunio marinus]